MLLFGVLPPAAKANFTRGRLRCATAPSPDHPRVVRVPPHSCLGPIAVVFARLCFLYHPGVDFACFRPTSFY